MSLKKHQNYELDLKKRGGIRANPKHQLSESPDVMTADDTAYDANQIYYFFDVQTQEVRQSTGLRRVGEHLCTFGLKVVAVSALRDNRDGALTDGQAFFKSEVERLQKRIAEFAEWKRRAEDKIKQVEETYNKRKLEMI